ncbi:hypothetical protein JNUCC64_16530 [Streptomyces sp. JNUCC 64]
MSESVRSEEVRDAFGPVRLLVPYLLFVVGDAGVRNTAPDDRPVLFWLFEAVVVLAVVVAVTRLRWMTRVHRATALPGWTRSLGVLLALYGLYVLFRAVDGIVP